MASILVVDDYAVNRELIVTLLRYRSHRTFEAADGAEALLQVREHQPDLVICDILMPTMDGFEFVRQLREDPATAGTNVIFCSAHFLEREARDLARACGVANVVVKPFEPEEMLRIVQNALAHATSHEQPLLSQDFGREHLRLLTDSLAEKVDTLERANRRLSALIDLNLRLASEREPNALLDRVCRGARDLLGARYAVLCVSPKLHGTEEYITTSGIDDAQLRGLDLPQIRNACLTPIFAERRALRFSNLGGDIRRIGLPAGYPAGDAALVCPIVSLDSVYGWICLVDKLGSSQFDDEDERILSIHAAQVGRVYENGSLYEQVRHHAAELEDSELRFRQLAENISQVFFLTNADATQMLYISPAYEEVWGRTRASWYSDPRSWTDCVHPDDVEVVRAGQRERKLIGRVNMTFRIVRPDGELRWVRARGFPIRDDSGLVYRVAGIAEDITERVRMEGALQERAAALLFAQKVAKLAHVVTRPDGSFESWSETLPLLLGLDADAMPRTTRDWLEFVHPMDRALFRATAIDAGRTSAAADLEYRIQQADGTLIRVRQMIEPMRETADADGRMRWFSTMQDVTVSWQAEEKIQRLNRVYAVLSGINATIVRVRERGELFRETCRIAVDEGHFRLAWIGSVDRQAGVVKPAEWRGVGGDYIALMPMGLDASEAATFGLAGWVVQQRKAAFVNDIANDPRIKLVAAALERDLRALAILPLEVADEVVGVLALYAGETDYFDADEMKLLGELAGDISFALQNIGRAERLDYLALYDTLTGLPNRMLFVEHLGQRVSEAARDGTHLAVIMFDVERFRHINDTLGRHTGDSLLKQLATRGHSFTAEPALFARLLGDQFALFISNVKGAENAARLVELGVRQVFGTPYRVGDTELRLTATLGIAMYPADGADAETLLRNAEVALKGAKATKERYLFYTHQMSERVAGQLSLENRLRRAIEREEFVLHYQPKVNMNTRAVIGAEALLRWQSPDEGLVPPYRFIGLLEETGMILEVGAWVLRQAVADRQRWADQGLPAPRVAVNVSAVQLRHRDFVDTVRRALSACTGPPMIDIELTESVVMEDVQASVVKLTAVRDMGLELAIDDFGTGYSSLGYLAKLPVRSLKIDRSFIMTMVDEADTMTLVATIISLAHSLRLDVIAEGVETESQASVLQALHCDQMQGYLISRPVPAAAFGELLLRTHH